MNQVTVKKTELLEIVKKNRDNHRKIFEEALEGYREEAIKILNKSLKEAKAGKRIIRSIGLIEPVDQTKDYDRVISMLEMSVDDYISLSSSEFSCYVQDDWHWKDQFLTSNSIYIKAK